MKKPCFTVPLHPNMPLVHMMSSLESSFEYFFFLQTPHVKNISSPKHFTFLGHKFVSILLLMAYNRVCDKVSVKRITWSGWFILVE